MQTTQKFRIKSEDLKGLDFDNQTYFIRLECGSEITIDKEIIKRLLDIEKAEEEFNRKYNRE